MLFVKLRLFAFLIITRFKGKNTGFTHRLSVNHVTPVWSYVMPMNK